MVLSTHKELIFKGSKKQHQILTQTAYYQAGKIVIQTILPDQPPVALITLNTLGTTCSTSADTYIPIENISNTQSCSFLESRLVSLYGGKAASLLIEYQRRQNKINTTPTSFAYPASQAPTPFQGLRPVRRKECIAGWGYPKQKGACETGYGKACILEKVEKSPYTDNEPINYVNNFKSLAPSLNKILYPAINNSDISHTKSKMVEPIPSPKSPKGTDLSINSQLATNSINYVDKKGKTLSLLPSSLLGLLTPRGCSKAKDFRSKPETHYLQSSWSEMNVSPSSFFAMTNRRFVQQNLGFASERMQSLTCNKERIDNVQNWVLDPSKFTLLQNKKLRFCIPSATKFYRFLLLRSQYPASYAFLLSDRTRAPLGYPKQEGVKSLKSANGKAYLAKTCFAGAGNNTFQSTLGNIEIQTATRLARIMVNYWNFYSLNKTPPFKIDASFQNVQQVNELNSLSITSVNKNKAVNSYLSVSGSFAHVAYPESFASDPKEGMQSFNQLRKTNPFLVSQLPKATNSVCIPQRGKANQVDKTTGNFFNRSVKAPQLLTPYPKELAKQLEYKPQRSSEAGVQLLTPKKYKTSAVTTLQVVQQGKLNENKTLLSSICNNKEQNVRKESQAIPLLAHKGYAKLRIPLLTSQLLTSKEYTLKKNSINTVEKNLHFAITQSKNSLQICENKKSSYNMRRLSVENLGDYSKLNNINFQLINSLQFSNLQRDRFSPNWFRLYLPDIEATEFLKNVANYYFSLGVQTLPFPSTKLSSYAASPFLTFLNKNAFYLPLHPVRLCFSPSIYPSVETARHAMAKQSFENSLLTPLKGSRPEESKAFGVRSQTVTVTPTSFAYPASYARQAPTSFAYLPSDAKQEGVRYTKQEEVRYIKEANKDMINQKGVFVKHWEKKKGSTYCPPSILVNYTYEINRSSNLSHRGLHSSNFVINKSVHSFEVAKRRSKKLGPTKIAKDQFNNVPFSLLLENQIFPLNHNGFSIVEKELLYNALVNSCFAKAFYLVNQNRQLLDFLVDYLLRFQILRQHQILYLFSTLLVGCNKSHITLANLKKRKVL